jgi:hypothetical protein
MKQNVPNASFLKGFPFLSLRATLGHSPCKSTFKPPQVWFFNGKESGEFYKLGARHKTAKAKSLAPERVKRLPAS